MYICCGVIRYVFNNSSYIYKRYIIFTQYLYSDYKCGDYTYATTNVCKSNCNEIEVANDNVTFEECKKCSKLEVQLRRIRNEASLLKIV